MKRTKLTYLFAFALLLGSCTMDDVDTEELLEIDPMTDMSISISGTVNNDSATKGVVIEDEASLATMGVYSYMTPADVTWGNQTGTDVSSFFNDFNTTYPITATYSTDDGAWGYGYTRYWPSDGSLLHFYAWAPTERINRTYNSTDGYPEFYHTLSSNAIDNYDLMWSVPQVDLKYSDENKGKVEFDFTHALSRISLYARVYVSKAYSIEKEPTNILSYERFGINGITFYDVVGRADVEYDSNLNPSWKPTTTGSRVSITASQGNTLLEHYNSIRTTTGQVPKVDEDTVDDGELTYKSVMMTQTDDDGTEESTDTHGIFLFPQTFCVNETTTDPDSPDAYMRVRIRHYENWFVSTTEAQSIINEIDDGGSEYEGEYYDHIYCNEDLEIAVIYFDSNATGTTDDTDGDSSISYVSKTAFLGESYSDNYLCVQKDQTGTLYTTSDLKLSDVFDNDELFPNGGIEPAQHIALYFTFDISDGAEVEVPMTVFAEVYPWVDTDVPTEVYDQLVVYSDKQEITAGSGTATFYTKCEENIQITDLTISGATLTNDPSGTEFNGSTDPIAHTFSYSGATVDTEVTVVIEIYKVSSDQTITKTFTYTVVAAEV
ncbi:MAG: hypothetical protein R3Y39_09310 [Rikenellaceae bacterium]